MNFKKVKIFKQTNMQKTLLTYIYGLNDKNDIVLSNGHRRCFKNKVAKMINQLKHDLNIPELKQWALNETNINNNGNDKEKKREFNFIKNKYDLLRLIPDREYYAYFNHIKIGEVAVLNSNSKITKKRKH